MGTPSIFPPQPCMALWPHLRALNTFLRTFSHQGKPLGLPMGLSRILEGEGLARWEQVKRAPEWRRARATEIPQSVHGRAPRRVQGKSHWETFVAVRISAGGDSGKHLVWIADGETEAQAKGVVYSRSGCRVGRK